MKCFAIVHHGGEKLCLTELQELVTVRAKNIPCLQAERALSLVETNLSPEEISTVLHHSQSIRGLALLLGKYSNLQNLHLQPSWNDFSWKDIFQQGSTFKVDVLNVKGQENRFDIAKAVSAVIFEEAKELNLSINFKKPEVVIIVFSTGKEYLIGLDLASQDLHKRDYRVFAHCASFTGDIAYELVRRSGFQPKEKLIIGMAKDGALPIEAALFANHLVIRKGPFKYETLPLFHAEPIKQLSSSKKSSSKVSLSKSAQKNEPPSSSQPLPQKEENPIFSFDPSRNAISARKNMVLAGTGQSVTMNKFALDELDVRYDKDFFDVCIIHLTAKDEAFINEAYYQAKYILKNQGRLFIITRDQFSLSLSDSFTLLSEDRLVRGDSVLKLWLLEKK